MTRDRDVIRPPTEAPRTCKTCGQPFTITVEEKAFFDRLATERPWGQGTGWRLPARCTPCRFAARREKYGAAPPVEPGPAVTLTCIDCGQVFTFSQGERAFFARQGWPLPRRCGPCRDARRRRHPSGRSLSERGNDRA